MGLFISPWNTLASPIFARKVLIVFVRGPSMRNVLTAIMKLAGIVRFEDELARLNEELERKYVGRKICWDIDEQVSAGQ